MTNFLHKLFNPHCPHCAAEAEAERESERLSRIDPTIEILKMELEKSQRRERLLLDKVMSSPSPEMNQVLQDTDGKTPMIVPKSTLWRATQARLESESLKVADEIRQKKIEELEGSVLGEKKDASE